VVLPVLLGELWLNRIQKPFFPAFITCFVIATLGLWLFMIYLWYVFGDGIRAGPGNLHRTISGISA
jgi:hypothetical protein